MAIRCPRCGAEYDVTLFTFNRAIRCDCGEWVDMSVGHRERDFEHRQPSRQGASVSDASAADDESLLAVCRTAYSTTAATTPGNASAAQLAIAAALRRAGYELDEDHEDMTAGLGTVLAVLADGRSIQLRASGEWVILRDSE